MEKTIKWTNCNKSISDLIPSDYNPRELTDDQAKDIRTSLDKFNLADPIVINANNRIIGGHQRIKMLKEAGVENVDVRIPSRELTTDEERELNLRLNKNVGQWDMDLLAGFSKDMLQDVGFDSSDLDNIFKSKSRTDDDDVPEIPSEAKTKAGDIYQLGRHKIMCGNSVIMEDVAKLMDGEKASMINTDPPYNINYGSSKKDGHKISKIMNDQQSPDEWEMFCKSIYNVFKVFNRGDIYVWGASSPDGMRMRLWLIEAGFHWSATIIWKKQRLVLSPAKYQRIYEPCFYGWLEKSSFCADRKQKEVWEIDRPSISKLHPTMKPVELCEKAINNSSKWNEIVLDLFLGSGSTLIACEKINRICYGMEIDPKYCDVIIQRWEEYTKEKAVLLDG